MDHDIRLDKSFSVNKREIENLGLMDVPFGAGTEDMQMIPCAPATVSIALIHVTEDGPTGIFALGRGPFGIYAPYGPEDLRKLASAMLEMARQLEEGVEDAFPLKSEGNA